MRFDICCNKEMNEWMNAGCVLEPLASSGLVDCSGSSQRGSCLDRLSLIVEGLNTTPKSTPDTGGCDVTSHVTVHDKMAAAAAAQAANCWGSRSVIMIDFLIVSDALRSTELLCVWYVFRFCENYFYYSYYSVYMTASLKYFRKIVYSITAHEKCAALHKYAWFAVLFIDSRHHKSTEVPIIVTL